MVASNFNLADCLVDINWKEKFCLINKWYERQKRLDQLEYALISVRLRYFEAKVCGENSAS